MSSYADLHLHTSFSDGADTPEQLVERAKTLGLAAIAVTDHDTIAGLARAAHAAGEAEIAFLDGVEITASYDGREVHVLGLGIDPACAGLIDALRELHAKRSARVDAIIRRLNAIGVDMTRDEVEAQAGQGTLGRIHVARATSRAPCSKASTDTSRKDARRTYPRRGCRALTPLA